MATLTALADYRAHGVGVGISQLYQFGRNAWYIRTSAREVDAVRREASLDRLPQSGTVYLQNRNVTVDIPALSYAEKLPIGATVRVRTADGKRHTAVLAVVDRDGITLESKTRVPEPARRFPYEQIQQLQLKNNGSNVVKGAAAGAAIGAGTFVGLLALLAANWD